MASTAFCLAKLVLTVSRVLLKQYYRIPKGLHRNFSNAHACHGQFQKSHSLAQRSELSDHILIFNVEGALLKSSSTFPYFMLVAFEAGSIIRAFCLFILYPFLCLLSQEISLKIMVMVCSFGIKKGSFRVGTAVLPKFFLEDVGAEGFEVLRRGGRRKVGVSDLPRVMVESFLKDYLEIDFVAGRELKVCCGYYVGLMEEKTSIHNHLEEIFDQDEKMCCDLIEPTTTVQSRGDGADPTMAAAIVVATIPSFTTTSSEIYLVNEEDKSKWHLLARDRYPKPLIFHDGRLAFRPTLLNMLAMFMWFPVGSILSITRVVVAISLPYNAAIPILIFTGGCNSSFQSPTTSIQYQNPSQ
ncbi:hypothetical protein RJ639_033593 [Escallonia herrerae]|uniref:Glycerol-3-phosphate acyltransferase RAM2/GPAT1-8 HAD-like domain-containing protein n=1 Tax=Escallonia herrerae TaxID=1293975 RepID=A0AA88WUY5_9ASTE|nr:hypothetical protein RJ639_033593 [Escallonia herrerae]